MPTPSLSALQRAISIAEKIESLQLQLASLLGGSSSPRSTTETGNGGTGKRGRRKMSPAARDRIAAAQRARWAKTKGTKVSSPAASAPKRKKRKLSAEGRARIIAAQKKRWAEKKG